MAVIKGMEAFAKQVSEVAAQASETFEPWHGFWYHRPTRDFPPASVREPEQWQPGERLALACTQTDLKPADQKKLLQRWCALLPTLRGVKILWIQSRCPQELFEAACAMPDLEGLYIKWGALKDCLPIRQLQGLRYLHIGGSPSLTGLDALAELKKLEWLELANIRAIEDLSFITHLAPLRGLMLAGDGNSIKYLYPASFAPLTSQPSLEWLCMTTLGVRDESLRPLAQLPRLKHLLVGNAFKWEEFAWLAGARPDLECDRFDPVGEPANWMTCKQCKQHSMVSLTGKGQPWLCRDCDAARIERFVTQYNAARQAASETACPTEKRK